MRLFLPTICLLTVFALFSSPCAAEDVWPEAGPSPATDSQAGITHVFRGETLARSGDPFSAIAEYRKAIELGYHQSDVYRSLSTVLYLAGFPDEAVDALKEAIKLHPKEVFPRLELGVLYFSLGRQDNAEEYFLSVLADNPTLANAYYYMGEISYRQGKYDEAWLYALRAQLLGHKDKSLFARLEIKSKEPAIDPRKSLSDEFCFRQILVDSWDAAEAIRKRIEQGEMFEVVASMESLGASAVNGGFVGCLSPDELDARLGTALWDQPAYGKPVVAETYQGAHVLQRVLPFDLQDWEFQLAALRRPESAKATTATAPAGTALPVPSPPVNKVGRYTVHAGSYSGPMLASAMVARLRDAKLPAFFFTSTNKDGSVLYRVVAGRYDVKREAEAASKRLTGMGINNFIATADKGEVSVEVAKAEPAAKTATPEKAPEKMAAVVPEPAVEAAASQPAIAAVESAGKKTEPEPEPAASPVPSQPAPSKSVARPGGSPSVPAPPPELVEASRPAPAAKAKAEPAAVAVAKDTVLPASLIVEKKSDEPQGRYTVHAGSLINRELTEKKITRLREAGVPSFAYVLTGKNGKPIFRVVAGRYDDIKEAKAVSKRLGKLGIDTFIANTK